MTARSKTSHGRVYGISSVQLRNFNPTEPIYASLSHSVDMHMRISGLEVHSEALKSNINELKQDVVAMKIGTTPPAAAARTAYPPPADVSTPSAHHAKTTNPTQEQSPLDKWCADLLGESCQMKTIPHPM
ncbi:unnamed protein product [Thlaspi arvense]|uniref:Uncharacterized protein n=1 Tax=Thlaspi arvense TaxID=13288 RepID=A0AAU9SL94_THLAR|nr:unnamed protein product [Thlaspi arvense]